MARAASKPKPEAPIEDPRARKIRIQASVLRGALGDVLGAVQARNTIPVLAHVLIEAGDGRIVLSATDLDIWARRDCATADRDGPGSADWISKIRPFACTIPAKPLAGILAELDGEAMVTLELREDSRIAVSAGRARFLLPTLPPTDFPEPPPLEVSHAFELTCSALLGAFERVDYAVSDEETRYYLNGVFIHVTQADGEPQWLVFAATDGHRLARWRIEVPEGAASLPDVILPRGTAEMLAKLLKGAIKAAEKADVPGEPPKVQIDVADVGKRMCFTMDAADGGEIIVQSKAIDGTFPDYVRVIPSAPPRVAVVAREALARAIKRVAVLSDSKSHAVKLVIGEDKIELLVRSPDTGEALEEIACQYDGPEMSIGFNGGFLRESLLSGASDDVALHLTDEGAPLLLLASGTDVRTAGLVQVVMPMRV